MNRSRILFSFKLSILLYISCGVSFIFLYRAAANHEVNTTLVNSLAIASLLFAFFATFIVVFFCVGPFVAQIAYSKILSAAQQNFLKRSRFWRFFLNVNED